MRGLLAAAVACALVAMTIGVRTIASSPPTMLASSGGILGASTCCKTQEALALRTQQAITACVNGDIQLCGERTIDAYAQAGYACEFLADPMDPQRRVLVCRDAGRR